MPNYDYACLGCGSFTFFCSIAESDEAQNCPRCGKRSKRVLLSAPSISGRGGPDTSRSGRVAFGRELAKWRKHSVGCGCCR
jgi:putative FmdB family regulatory protein